MEKPTLNSISKKKSIITITCRRIYIRKHDKKNWKRQSQMRRRYIRNRITFNLMQTHFNHLIICLDKISCIIYKMYIKNFAVHTLYIQTQHVVHAYSIYCIFYLYSLEQYISINEWLFIKLKTQFICYIQHIFSMFI